MRKLLVLIALVTFSMSTLVIAQEAAKPATPATAATPAAPAGK